MRIRYFAYGSNMSAAQMAQRCPGAADPTPAVLSHHAWMCNERGVATVVPVDDRAVHGVLWDVTADHLVALDRHEGVADGRYRRDAVAVTTRDGTETTAVMYVDDRNEPGPPRDGYLERVLAGAAEHALPDEWLDYLQRWAHVPTSPRRTPSRAAGPKRLDELLALDEIDEVVELRSPFGFMAIHGGGLEIATDLVAELAAAQAGASFYAVRYPDDADHHLPSIAYRPQESPALDRFLDHVDTVVSVHGYGRRGRWTDVLVGGRNRDLAAHVAAHLAPRLEGYRVVTDLEHIPRELRGQHADNPVNRPANGGVQLELPPRIRGLSPLSPPAGADGVSPPTRALIDGLAASAAATNE